MPATVNIARLSLSRAAPALAAWLLIAVLCPTPDVRGDEHAIREVIDQHVAAGWQARGISPSAPASDAEFLRRVTLDLIGTVPTAAAARSFLADPAPDKRERLVDALLASPEHARHMAQVFDVLLLERQYGNYVTDQEWHEYLRASFVANKPWDQMARELLGSDGTDPATRPAMRFYCIRTLDSYRVVNPNALARDIGRLFLGVNLQCAQCHDHPTIPDYHQADYYGLVAFTKRCHFFIQKVGDKDVWMIAETADGTVTYSSAFDDTKAVHETAPRLPGGPELPDPALAAGAEYKVAPADGVMPIPVHSRRDLLTRTVTDRGNPAFARNIVNRLWGMLLGRGIVHPYDVHHGGNPPSHPELLAALAERFAAGGHDIRTFLREVVLSHTYQLSSVPADPAAPPPADAFAAAVVRPLRPEQLCFALLEAVGYAGEQRAALGAEATEAKMYEVLSAQKSAFVTLFGRAPGQAEDSYESSLDQALFLGNSDPLAGMVRVRPGNLTDRLRQLPDAVGVAEALYLSVFTRPPTPDEVLLVEEHLRERAADRDDALAELVWAALTSVEFRFNH